MIDTLGFFVPVSSQTYDFLMSSSILTQRVDKRSGDIEFEYNNFSLNHSYNYKVLFRLDNKVWQYDINSKSPVLVEGIPYLKFEFSAPKIFWGHNLYSCSVSDACTAANYVRDAFNDIFDVQLPKVRDWYCYRLDTCANFVLDNIEQVKSYIRYLQKFDYPRRVKNLYEDTGIYFASRNNTLKIYCKGVEFKKHDAKRFLSEFEQKQLQNFANKILRIEVEHKNKLKFFANDLKINYSLFQGYMKIYDLLNVFDVRCEMEKVVNKFLSGSETKVMKSLDVYKLLCANLDSRSANFYYSIYTLLITQGQNETKRQVKKATYYKALKLFRELGISIIASDIQKLDISLSRGFPEDFSIRISEDNKYYQVPKAA